MRNLFKFISRYYFFFLFLALQTIAMLMVANSHQYQRAVMLRSANQVTSFFHRVQTNVHEYFALRRLNKDLALQNNMLLHQTPFSFLKTDQQEFLVGDTLYQRRYLYVNARVINNSVTRRNNFLTLDKGRRHGIHPDMGIITARGVIGIVNNVSENFATVISLLHADVNISVRMKKNGHLGTLQWDGEDYRQATVLYIPTHVELNVGDTIVSSGFSTIFPPDVLIGTISNYIIHPGENFSTVQVTLAQDFNNLSYVHAVKNLFREELDSLESMTISGLNN
ncbi:MAG: rod shape-determining protein MreC [Bacteroidales bacterium]